MFTQDFYLMTVRIKAPDHPAFAMKRKNGGSPTAEFNSSIVEGPCRDLLQAERPAPTAFSLFVS